MVSDKGSELKRELTESLKELRLPTIRAEFEESARRAQNESLSYEQYLAELNGHLDGIRTECLNSRVDYQRLSTSQPLDVALSSYLATRMALSR